MGRINNLSNTFRWNLGPLKPIEHNKSNPTLFAYLVATMSKTFPVAQVYTKYSLTSTLFYCDRTFSFVLSSTLFWHLWMASLDISITLQANHSLCHWHNLSSTCISHNISRTWIQSTSKKYWILSTKSTHLNMHVIFSKCNNTNKPYGNLTHVTHTCCTPFASAFVDCALEYFCLQYDILASGKFLFTLLLQTKASFIYFLLDILWKSYLSNL